MAFYYQFNTDSQNYEFIMIDEHRIHYPPLEISGVYIPEAAINKLIHWVNDSLKHSSTEDQEHDSGPTTIEDTKEESDGRGKTNSS